MRPVIILLLTAVLFLTGLTVYQNIVIQNQRQTILQLFFDK